MYKYVGIKLIEAEPAYKVVGACQQVQIVPAKEVRKKDLPKCAQEGYKIRYSDGYESWSPKAAFEEAYRDVGKMSFPMAMAMLQKGAHVARHYWDTVEEDGDWATRKYLFMERDGGRDHLPRALHSLPHDRLQQLHDVDSHDAGLLRHGLVRRGLGKVSHQGLNALRRSNSQ